MTKIGALLVVYGTALAFGLFAYWDYRDSHISRIIVSKLSDLEQEFEVRDGILRVKNPDFLKVCFAGDYAYALKDARQWFSATEADFMPVLQAAGGRADRFNGEKQSSIVLLSHRAAAIVQLDRRNGFSVINFGCANVDGAAIQMRMHSPNSATELFLPRATLKEARAGQAPASLCAVHIQRLVNAVDALMTEAGTPEEHYWAIMRKYLPPEGCTIEEVEAIARTSRFYLPLVRKVSAAANHTVAFRNADTLIHFGLTKDTRIIVYPFVGPRYPPTPSL